MTDTVRIADVVVADNIRLRELDVLTLTESVKRRGIIEPIVLTRIENEWRLIAGHRRLAAAEAAGLKEIPFTEYDLVDNDQDRIAVQYHENTEREDLTLYERLQATLDLKELGLKQDEIATELGISRKDVSEAQKIARSVPKDQRADAAKLTTEGLGELIERSEGELGLVGPAITFVLEGQSTWNAVASARKALQLTALLEEESELVTSLAELGHEINDDLPQKYIDHWEMESELVSVLVQYVGDRLDVDPETGESEPWDTSWTNEYKLDLEAHRKEECHWVHVSIDWEGAAIYEVCLEITRHQDGGDSDIATEVETPKVNRAVNTNSQDTYAQQQKEKAAKKKEKKKAAIEWAKDNQPSLTGKDIQPYVDAAWVELVNFHFAQWTVGAFGWEKVQHEGTQGGYNAVGSFVDAVRAKYQTPATRMAYVSFLLHVYTYVNNEWHAKDTELGVPTAGR